jgi:hypothetical protein
LTGLERGSGRGRTTDEEDCEIWLSGIWRRGLVGGVFIIVNEGSERHSVFNVSSKKKINFLNCINSKV